MLIMPKALPKEFRDNAVAMARAGDIPVAQLAKELGISESGLRRWMAQADVEEGARPGVTRSESAEVAALRRRNKVLEQEVEILKRASAYFARENILPK
jgi:transposase-like protein